MVRDTQNLFDFDLWVWVSLFLRIVLVGIIGERKGLGARKRQGKALTAFTSDRLYNTKCPYADWNLAEALQGCENQVEFTLRE